MSLTIFFIMCFKYCFKFNSSLNVTPHCPIHLSKMPVCLARGLGGGFCSRPSNRAWRDGGDAGLGVVLKCMKLWKCLRLQRELPVLYRGERENRVGWGCVWALWPESRGERSLNARRKQASKPVTAGRGIEDEDGAVPVVSCMMTLESCFSQPGRK